MTARQRRENEPFKAYRQDLKEEAGLPVNRNYLARHEIVRHPTTGKPAIKGHTYNVGNNKAKREKAARIAESKGK